MCRNVLQLRKQEETADFVMSVNNYVFALSFTQRCPGQHSVLHSAVRGSTQFDSALSRKAISLTQKKALSQGYTHFVRYSG